MINTHKQNIAFLKNLFKKEQFEWIQYDQILSFHFFKSGGGTHLYLIKNGGHKYLARINFYPGKNEWGVKTQEYKALKLIEHLKRAPKVFFLSTKNELEQDLTIVEYIEGEVLTDISQTHVVELAKTLQKLHESFSFQRRGDSFPPDDELPYHCNVYNEFANGDDKQIEKYSSWDKIEKVIEPYKRINKKLGQWFNNLDIFKGCKDFCLCHSDLKKENIVKTQNGVVLIDWECACSDIPETDIAKLFSGCAFSQEQQEIFLKKYFKKSSDKETMQRIIAIQRVLDFFRILENYIILKRKKWNADKMLSELLKYEKVLDSAIKK